MYRNFLKINFSSDEHKKELVPYIALWLLPFLWCHTDRCCDAPLLYYCVEGAQGHLPPSASLGRAWLMGKTLQLCYAARQRLYIGDLSVLSLSLSLSLFSPLPPTTTLDDRASCSKVHHFCQSWLHQAWWCVPPSDWVCGIWTLPTRYAF